MHTRQALRDRRDRISTRRDVSRPFSSPKARDNLETSRTCKFYTLQGKNICNQFKYIFFLIPLISLPGKVVTKSENWLLGKTTTAIHAAHGKPQWITGVWRLGGVLGGRACALGQIIYCRIATSLVVSLILLSLTESRDLRDWNSARGDASSPMAVSSPLVSCASLVVFDKHCPVLVRRPARVS